ncbi:UNVERIFIED_CONTAM: hypothetical protein GTU68_013580, partial [Idotea baltica]|nr:hypothetical protein [Idotea baltica]
VGRKRAYAPLNVFLNNRLLGQLNREKSGAIRFQYDREWIEWEHAIPVSISLPLREDQFTGAQVMAVFENLLPDNAPIRRRVAERVGAQGTDAFSLLSEIGKDCIGALQFLSEDETPQEADKLTGETLNDDDIEKLLTDLDVTPLGIRSENSFRISVAGAQEKTALLFNNEKWIQPSGTTPTSHIIKPQIGKLHGGIDLSNSVENEYFCLKLLHHFGLKTAHTQIKTFGNKKALCIERFDRRWTKDGKLIRLPQEDCCQALSVAPTGKYQSEGGPGIVELMNILRGSDNPIDDRLDFFKANILFWLIGATDGHAKNFSLALSSRGRFRMTPLYDVLTLQTSVDQKCLSHKDFKLAMRVGQSNQYNVERIRGRHFVDTGVQAGLSRKRIADLFEVIKSEYQPALDACCQELEPTFPQELIESVSNAMEHRIARLIMP